MINSVIRQNKKLQRRLAAYSMTALLFGSVIACESKINLPESTASDTVSSIETTQTPASTVVETIVPTEFTTEEITKTAFNPEIRPDLQGTATLDAPIASHNSGMYKDPIEVSFEVPEGMYLYYTTDGSDPAKSGTAKLYTGAITVKDRSNEANVLHAVRPSQLSADYVNDMWTVMKTKVDKGTVVRACLVKENGEFSPTTSHTYLIGLDNARYNDLVVVSLSTDYKNLFDSESGIYVLGNVYKAWRKENPWGELNGSTPANYNQRGKEWERDAYMEVFGVDGTVLLSQGCGIRTQGGWSRSAWQKSFRMIARKEYGSGTFKADLFDGALTADGSKELVKFDTLVMRNGGNDAGFSKLKDKVLQTLVADRNFETQQGRPAVLFLNGEYWGLYTLVEYYDADYFKNNYGVDPDNVCFYKNYDMDEGTEEDDSEFWQMIDQFKNSDFSDDAEFEKAKAIFDVDSFIDYMATEIYINNQDWPGGNFGMWKVRTPDPENPYADGRWRMTLFDTEYSTNMYGDQPTAKGCWQNDNIKRILEEDCVISDIFRAFLKNEGFRQKFITTLLDLMNVEFSYENYEEVLEYYKDQYLPELERHYEAFPGWMTVENCALPTIGRMSEFMELRPSYVPQMLKNNFGLNQDTITLTCNTNADTLHITCNSSTITAEKIWDGTYFTDLPITLTALEVEGYQFLRWEISSATEVDLSARQITLTLSADTSITALYEKIN